MKYDKNYWRKFYASSASAKVSSEAKIMKKRSVESSFNLNRSKSRSTNYGTDPRKNFEHQRQRKINYYASKYIYNHKMPASKLTDKDWDNINRIMNEHEARRYNYSRHGSNNTSNGNNSRSYYSNYYNSEANSRVSHGSSKSVFDWSNADIPSRFGDQSDSDYQPHLTPHQREINRLKRLSRKDPEDLHMSPGDKFNESVADRFDHLQSERATEIKRSNAYRKARGIPKHFRHHYSVNVNPRNPNANYKALHTPGAQKGAIRMTNGFARAADHESGRTTFSRFMKGVFQMMANDNARVADNRFFQNVNIHSAIKGVHSFRRHHHAKRKFRRLSRESNYLHDRVNLHQYDKKYQIDSELDSLVDANIGGNNNSSILSSDPSDPSSGIDGPEL